MREVPSMPDTVGYFPYLNLWPFVRGLPDDVERVIASPRALAEYARAGRLDVAILPVVDLPTLTDRYEPLGDLGLAVAGPVWSVLLLTRRPIEALSGARICATPESSTSVRLLTLLLKVRYGVRHWRWWPTPGEADAWLVIGDTALSIARARGIARADDPSDACPPEVPVSRAPPDGDAVSRGPASVSGAWTRIYDLADEWTRWQGLPFVFARWVARRDRPASWRQAWYERLSATLADHLPRLHGGGPVDGLRPWQIAYLRRFEYRLSPVALEGGERFRALAAGSEEGDGGFAVNSKVPGDGAAEPSRGCP
jgi:predicted solute-binding protein